MPVPGENPVATTTPPPSFELAHAAPAVAPSALRATVIAPSTAARTELAAGLRPDQISKVEQNELKNREQQVMARLEQFKIRTDDPKYEPLFQLFQSACLLELKSAFDRAIKVPGATIRTVDAALNDTQAKAIETMILKASLGGGQKFTLDGLKEFLLPQQAVIEINERLKIFGGNVSPSMNSEELQRVLLPRRDALRGTLLRALRGQADKLRGVPPGSPAYQSAVKALHDDFGMLIAEVLDKHALYPQAEAGKARLRAEGATSARRNDAWDALDEKSKAASIEAVKALIDNGKDPQFSAALKDPQYPQMQMLWNAARGEVEGSRVPSVNDLLADPDAARGFVKQVQQAMQPKGPSGDVSGTGNISIEKIAALAYAPLLAFTSVFTWCVHDDETTPNTLVKLGIAGALLYNNHDGVYKFVNDKMKRNEGELAVEGAVEKAREVLGKKAEHDAPPGNEQAVQHVQALLNCFDQSIFTDTNAGNAERTAIGQILDRIGKRDRLPNAEDMKQLRNSRFLQRRGQVQPETVEKALYTTSPPDIGTSLTPEQREAFYLLLRDAHDNHVRPRTHATYVFPADTPSHTK